MEILPSMSPRHAVYIQDYVIRCGGDPEAVFCAAGWPMPEDNDQLPIPVSTLSRMFEEASTQLKDPDFGIHTAEFFPYESSGLLTLAMLSANNVEEAIRVLSRYGKHIDSGFTVEPIPGDDQLIIEFEILDLMNAVHTQLQEYLVALFLQIIRTGTKKAINPVEVSFALDPSRERASVKRFFACPVSYGTVNRLRFEGAVLAEKFVTAHHLLFDMLTRALQSFFRSDPEDQDLMTLVSREIIKHTSNESLRLETVAEELSMSPRTLRRKLAEEGHSFQDAKKVIRRNRAEYFLASTSMSVAEIAYELGYSEISAFSRAFRNWTGESPQTYRQREKE